MNTTQTAALQDAFDTAREALAKITGSYAYACGNANRAAWTARKRMNDAAARLALAVR